jgi:hypothetical protein
MVDIETSSSGTENRFRGGWAVRVLVATWESGMTEPSLSKSLSSSTWPKEARLFSLLERSGGFDPGETFMRKTSSCLAG